MNGSMGIVLAVAVGWVWGSFLNLLVDRTPRAGRPSAGTALRPARSHCPGCGVQLAWRDLVPIVSYLALRGRCRACGTAIGRRTLVVECLTPLLFGGFAYALVNIQGHAAWGAVAGFGFAALSWLLVAVPLLIEGRPPKSRFLIIGMGLLAALCASAVVLALDAMIYTAA